MTVIHRMGAAELVAAVRSKTISARDATAAYLARIDKYDRDLNVYLSRNAEALADAEKIDAMIAAGVDPGPLAGLPMAVKDNIAIRGWELTCGSKILAGYRSPYDATAVERLRTAGAVFLGKTNLDEFAMGSSTENSAFGPSRNPWDTSRAPGGSSGGSAVAVAAGLAAAALGSETGGSVRQPASLCSTVGLKPTYGRISRYGLVAFGSSLDQIGVMTRDVRGTALITKVMAGADPRDSTASHQPVGDYDRAMSEGLAGLRVGIPAEYVGEGCDPRVRAVVDRAVEEVTKAGATVLPAALPHTRFAIPVYYIVATAEASSNLARFDGVAYGPRTGTTNVHDMYRDTRMAGFGDEVKRRIMLGTFSLSSGYYDAYYDKALRVRTLLKRDFDEAFRSCDLLLGPTSPILPFKLGEKVDDPLAMYLADVLTAPLNLAGVPGINLPAGFVEEGGKRLPVGIQFIAPDFREDLLFRAGAAFQQATKHHLEAPIA